MVLPSSVATHSFESKHELQHKTVGGLFSSIGEAVVSDRAIVRTKMGNFNFEYNIGRNK